MSSEGGKSIIRTDAGTEIEVPFDAYGTFAVGSAVKIDTSSGGIEIYPASVLSTITGSKDYMNFFADDYAEVVPNADVVSKNVNGSVSSSSSVGTFSPHAFADMPASARKLSAANGTVVFAADDSAGLVVSCDSKVIMRARGASEFVTPHLCGLFGKTVIVSNFKDDVHIEIDLINEPSGSSTSYDGIKTGIVTAMRDGGLSYTEAFENAASGDPFLLMFGLNMAEILMKFKWSKFCLLYTSPSPRDS